LSRTHDAGTLGQFVLVCADRGGSVGALAKCGTNLQRAPAAWAHRELLRRRRRSSTPRTRGAAGSRAGDVAFDDVTFHYPMRRICRAGRFHLRVRPGEPWPCRPSGAGKSTVFSLLLRFHDPQAGAIRIERGPHPPARSVVLRDAIALVPQQPTIFASRRATTSATVACEASDVEVGRGARA
jgi:ATP-binding cassette subfamily B protein